MEVVVAAAARALRSLGLLARIAPLSGETVERLRGLMSRRTDQAADIRENAIAALAAAGAYDVETLVGALSDPAEGVRRIAARALSGAASGFPPDERHDLIRKALRDSAATVRLEAVRAWARREAREHGCGPLVDALTDASMHVVLEAIDLLGGHCQSDEAITDRITAGARTPTSRDTRLALIERLRELGSAAQAAELTRLLPDSDPVVSEALAETIAYWTGTRPDVLAPSARPYANLADPRWSNVTGVLLVLASGRRLSIVLSDETPITRVRFLELVSRKYYDGLTFHRVEPNFVVQGGSPNAHEYVGDRDFMRDEVGLAMHTRGTVGLSTRGRDTDDAQFFINLVDSPNLDHEYTVFARSPAPSMEFADGILDGDVITRVELPWGR